ncbi:carboxypeptidase [Verrucomicrobia bacterium LW23]|nr:carboxypeptidase [Verrucomicrobia bacterium LW23]
MNASAKDAYRKLLAHSQELGLIANVVNLLQWDEDTNLPPRGVEYRAEQLSYLVGLVHSKGTAPEIGEWLQECEEGGAQGDIDAGPNIREWRRDYDRQLKLPARLVQELAHTSSLAREAWLEARRTANFALFQPKLTRIVELCREKADAWATCPSRYDTLLDSYEQDARTADLRPLFADLQQRIATLLPAAIARTASTPADLLKGNYPEAQQAKLNRVISEAIGFDFNAGRMDVSPHPFCCSPGPRDVRITTRYDETNFTSSLFGVMHECGHAMYDQGLPADRVAQPLGEAVSLGIHESQSRLWENQLGRSAAFWRHWYPTAIEFFPSVAAVPLDSFLLAVNRVEPSFIRVDADEVTYNLHILLRFEMEHALIEGKLSVADLPDAWNTRFEELFGLKVPDDGKGCLQDIHWCSGGFGYFPTYTLGTLNAAQLFHAANTQVPALAGEIASGHYAGLRKWLNTNVHAHGRRYTPQELMRLATGESTNARYFCDYLEEKFLPA